MTDSVDTAIAEHYGGAALLDEIKLGLEKLGKASTDVTVEDLGPVGEFHIGGRPATVELCDQLELNLGADVLDIGCGIGATAQFIAATYGCKVTGIDLTPNYIAAARTLATWTGLQDQVAFEAGSALDLPFAGDRFDTVVQLHVGMNIADKDTLFAEIHRVLRPGGTLGLYDIMRTGDGEIAFPVPWSTVAATSFVADVATYRFALGAAGFEVTAERNRAQFALEYFGAMSARTEAAGGPPPLGLHVIVGADTPQKIANMVGAISAGVIAPVELICRKPA